MKTNRHIEFLIACETGDFVKAINNLQEGKIPDTSSYDNGWTPLMRAASWGENVELVSFLIEKGANVNDIEPEFGYTALCSAAEEENLEIMEALLIAGSNLNHQDFAGQTPLMASIITNKFESVKFLIDHDADLSLTDNDGRTAKDIAYGMGYGRIVEYFEENDL